MNDIKEILYRYCCNYAEQRINAAKKAIEDAMEASANETKSSAGDKYETARAMMQQEIDRNRQQITEAGKLKQSLERINGGKSTGSVKPGSLVITNNGNFYLAVSAGSFSHNDVQYYLISPASPLGQKLFGLKAGDTCAVNGKTFQVNDVL